MSAAKQKKPLISKKEWRMFWLISLGLAVISGGGTALTAWLSKPEEPKNILPSQSPFKSDTPDTISRAILLSDFDLPAPGGQWLSKSWLYAREGGGRPWTWEEITPYWTPVERLPIYELPQKNEKAIEGLFGGVR